MAGQSINNIFDDILNNSQEIVVKAVKKAALKAQNDVIEEAKTYLQEYYNNYSPKIYQRTYKLRRSIFPYWADRSGGGTVSIEVGVQYKSSGLKGAYRSNSRYHQSGDVWRDITKRDDSPNNGIPQPDWILENFLHGQHGGYQQDFQATYTLMEEFLENELPNRIGAYVESELFAAITSRL